MRHRIALLSFITVFCGGCNEERLQQISWLPLEQQGKLPSAAQVTSDGSLKVTAEAATVTALTIKAPPITQAKYALRGRIRYEDVQGTGYLEMWSFFPDGSRYFSRTGAEDGPLQSLRGTSDWRAFALPFYSTSHDPAPTELIVNVVLPGKGTVYLSPLELRQYGTLGDPMMADGQWWSDRMAGLVGGTAGSLIGICGALIGVLSSLGRARRFVLGMTKVLCVIGIAALAVGWIALLKSQPYAVFYPLLLLGILLTAIFGGMQRTIRKRYEERELRRISAMDASPSGV